MLPEWINWWNVAGFAAVLLFCVLPLVLIAMALFFGATQGREILDQIVMPDPDKLEQRFVALRQRNARLSSDRLVSKIINQESLKCGVVGFVTGFGGIPLMPLTVPIDALASMRIQAAMVQFIARAYGHSEGRADVERVKTYLILAGSSRLTSVTTALIRRIFIRVFLKSTLKVVPVIGGVIGLIANLISTQAIGHMAVRWYRGDLRRLGLSDAVEQLVDGLDQAGALGQATRYAEGRLRDDIDRTRPRLSEGRRRPEE